MPEYWKPPEIVEQHPHPAPITISETGKFVTRMKVRGWGTLHSRLGVGWSMQESRALGWEMDSKGVTGELTESIVMKFEHTPTRARAVSMIARPCDHLTYEPRGKWAHQYSYAWVAGEHGLPVTWPYRTGSRALTKALGSVPVPEPETGIWVARSTVEDE